MSSQEAEVGSSQETLPWSPAPSDEPAKAPAVTVSTFSSVSTCSDGTWMHTVSKSSVVAMSVGKAATPQQAPPPKQGPMPPPPKANGLAQGSGSGDQPGSSSGAVNQPGTGSGQNGHAKAIPAQPKKGKGKGKGKPIAAEPKSPAGPPQPIRYGEIDFSRFRQETMQDTIYRQTLAGMKRDAEDWDDWYRSRGRRVYPVTPADINRWEQQATLRVAKMLKTTRSTPPDVD